MTLHPGLQAFCPACGQLAHQPSPAVPVWHCADCGVTLRLTGTQIEAIARRLARQYGEPAPASEPAPEPEPEIAHYGRHTFPDDTPAGRVLNG